MKSLKIGLLTLFMVIGNLVLAQQQDNKTPEERATAHSKKLTQDLGLTADQEKNVYTACLAHAQQMDADRTKYKGDREAMKTARQQNNQTLDASLGKILTADQKTKYEQMKQDEKAKRQEGGGRKGGGGN
jgi:protein CpxP